MRRLDARLSLPVYEQSLIDACEEFPPPFGTSEYGDVYREAAADPGWLVVSLITNAEREGDGAQRLWSLAASTLDPELAARIKQHAIDESNHSKIYLKLVDFVFPGAIEPAFRTQMETLSPGYTRFMTPAPRDGSPFSHPINLDDLIQMNIAEIRTTIHHLLQRPMLRAFCPAESYARVKQLLQGLLHDEIKHVAYTAELIESSAATVGVDEVRQLFRQRLKDFNEVTLTELESRVFDVT
jgi:hypothetical protein